MNALKNTAIAVALIAGVVGFSVNANAQSNLVVNGSFSDTLSSAWSGISVSGGSWNYYSTGSAGTFTAAQNMWTNPATLSQSINIAQSGNYQLSFVYIANSGQTSGPYTYSVNLGSLNHILSSPIGFGSPQQTYTYDVYLNAGVQNLAFGGGNTNSTYFLLSDISLMLVGPSTADTQASLVNTASALQNTYTLQNSVLANSFSYDCNVFGENGVCVSAGGRNTAVSAANGLNNTSGLLIAAYRAMSNVRVGAYADQNLSVNNAGSTVNLGNNTPLIGAFAAWDENLDGTGTEVKVTAAYGQKNATINRSVVGTSEAGTGSSSLISQGAQATVKYGFGIADNLLVSPYAGIRYTQNNMGGYTENASSTVTAPLTYSALNTNATTALAGVGVSYKGIPLTTLMASAGVESDTNTANGTYSATGVTGLTPINFNSNPVRTRPTASLGAYYDIEKNQRLGLTGIYRQEAYQAVSTTTVMATYTVGF